MGRTQNISHYSTSCAHLLKSVPSHFELPLWLLIHSCTCTSQVHLYCYEYGPSEIFFIFNVLIRTCSGSDLQLSVKQRVSHYSRLWVERHTHDGSTASCRGTIAWWDGWLLRSQFWKASVVGECVGVICVYVWVCGLFVKLGHVQMYFST